ncbi:hypothetical protein [Mucilaginibacter defluvii]
MRKILLPVIAFMLAACQTKEQKNNDTVRHGLTDTVADTSAAILKADTAVDTITYIKQKVEHINTQNIQPEHTEFMCDERMKVDRYFENGKLVKISVDFGTVGDVYAKEDYYYDNGKLIFKYEFVEGGPACEGCIKKNEYRSYVADNKVIKYLKDKNQERCRTCVFEPKAKENKLIKAKSNQEIEAILCRR